MPVGLLMHRHADIVTGTGHGPGDGGGGVGEATGHGREKRQSGLTCG